MAFKNSQVADQSVKGLILGVVSYFLVKWNVDAEVQAGVITAVTAGLAYASTKVGDKNVASFLAKAAKEAPAIIAEVQEKVAEVKAEAPKPAAKKKAPAKKAPAKPAQ